MPRHPRIAPGGFPQHVLNRAAGKIRMFARDKDFLAFENLLLEAHQRFPIPILAWCLMSNHWHFVVHPTKDGQDWRWSSLYVRQQGPEELRAILSPWPVRRPADWVRHVNEPLTTKEKAAMELSLRRCQPFGSDKWIKQTVAEQRLEHTIRREGRPSREKPARKSLEN